MDDARIVSSKESTTGVSRSGRRLPGGNANLFLQKRLQESRARAFWLRRCHILPQLDRKAA